MDVEAIDQQISEARRDRKWILIIDAAAAATRVVERLNDQGVTAVMIVAPSEGVGEVPTVDRLFYTRTTGDEMIPAIRAFVASIEAPSDKLLRAVEAFDPSGEALVLNAGFSRKTELLGRPSYGTQKPEWRDLEDKMIVDEIWDSAGVERAPMDIVAVGDAPEAAKRLASELGTVWVADNTEGWHGGGAYLRWVRSAEDVAPATAWFADHSTRVRVMPFLDGIPCSIHGFITRNGVAVFNPVELTILREQDRPVLHYSGGSNFWEAPPSVAAQMRTAARSVGELLAERHGYLGAYGIDGICTADGFRPTELNPRYSLGHNVHAATAEVPLWDMEWAMLAGDLDIDAGDLEETLRGITTEIRRGGAMFELEGEYAPGRTGFMMEDGTAVAVEADETNDGIMEIGDAPFGSAIFARFDPRRTPFGPSAAPIALAVLDLARDIWAVDFPELEPAPDLRPKL